MRRLGRVTITAVLVSLGLSAAIWPAAHVLATEAVDPERRAFLMIDPGMHTGPITAVTTDAGGDVVATGSSDKSIRLFAAEDGRQVRKIHLPLGRDLIGAVTGLALSPNGSRMLAATVSFDTGPAFDEGSLYVVDTAGGELLGRIKQLPAAPTEIRFTPDGARFAFALGPHGVELRNARGERLFADVTEPVAALDVNDDRLVTVSPGGKVRMFALDGASVRETDAVGIRDAGEPLSAALSPDGARLAVGYVDRPFVDVIDLAAKRKTRLAAPAGLAHGNLARVAWTESAEPWLVAGGTLQTRALQNVLVGWRDGREGTPFVLPVAADAITGLVTPRASGDTILFASADPAWGRVAIDAAGEARVATGRAGERLDFRQLRQRRFEVAPDGRTVVFSDREPQRPTLRFDMTELELETDAAPEPTFASVDLERLSARLGAWQYSTAVELDGRPLPLDPHERLLSADIDEGGPAGAERIVLGTDYRLRLLDGDGDERAARRLPAAAWMVALVPERPLVVAALGDGTIRWYSLKEDLPLAEIAGLFVHGDMRRWVAWTADGTFAHGIYGGERLVGYQQNGTAMAPTGTWLGFDQAYRLFHDPEAVAGVLGDESGWPDLARDTAVDTLFDGLELPSLEVVAYCALDEVPRDLVARGIVLQGPVQLAAPLPSPGGAEDACVDVADAPADRAPGLTRTLNLPAGTHALRVRLDIEDRAADLAVVDALVDGRNVGRVEPPRGADRVADRLTVERVVPVPADDATLVFRARRRDGVAADSAPLTLRVDRSPAAPLAAADQAAAAPVAPEEDARLFMLIVGVDAYGGPITPLKFAVADASTFGRVVAQAKADVYDEIETIELVDSAATRDAVIDALRRIASEARAGDAVLIYLAGHGVTSDETGYVFVTVDVTDPATVGSSGLDQATLADLLAEIPAENVMVLLDTCYAGAFDLKQPANLAQESGYFVLTGSSSVEAALDSYNGENGVLAFAVKQGLTGQAASPDGRIDALQLGVYARRTVPELAAEKNHRQSAVFKAAGGDLKEFPITTVSKSGG